MLKSFIIIPSFSILVSIQKKVHFQIHLSLASLSFLFRLCLVYVSLKSEGETKKQHNKDERKAKEIR